MSNYALLRINMLSWAYLFHWAYASDFRRVFGLEKRNKAIEYNLPYLVKKKKLKARRWEHSLIYSMPGTKGTSDYSILHGLHCTDALIRFHLSKEGVYISERHFKAMKAKVVPEWGIVYGDVLLLFEYSTADNFSRKKMIGRKLDNYRQTLDWFRKEFKAEPYLVYVIDAPEKDVVKYAESHDLNNFYFTDARQFYSVEEGKQLSARIYLWRGELVTLYGNGH